MPSGDVAVFNPERTHRYLLTRYWSDAPPMAWLLLNPSTADAATDDPTVRRCSTFARREGFGGISVVNLFALRATDPADVRRHPDPIGTGNDTHILNAARLAGLVLAGWGAHGGHRGRDSDVSRLLARAGIRLHCLGLTMHGHPRHPLYLPSSAPIVPYDPAPAIGATRDEEIAR
jgi:hypothetical protein